MVTEAGSILLGAPTDAFKATKSYCERHKLPFPRVLVAPLEMLSQAAPQFNPEFFLYDFLFVYGAAFHPEFADERLVLVMDDDQVKNVLRSLEMTLTGPTEADLRSYVDDDGKPLVEEKTIRDLSRVSEHMSIKAGDKPRELKTMVCTTTFDSNGEAELLDGEVRIKRSDRSSFLVRHRQQTAEVDISITKRVTPYSVLPVPAQPQRPLSFAVKPLGTRSGFDLSGPSTGFLIWVNGRVVVYDGPVGTRFLIEHQGISCEEIDVVILSHCHDDHMGAFVELIISGQRPKVYTTIPIFRSALLKLSTYFRLPPEEVENYIDYYPVKTGEPFEALGATFEFFYTVHSIPTVGLSVTFRDHRGTNHRAVISGDTMHHEGLLQLKAEGVISGEIYADMRNLVPKERMDNSIYFCDVGESIIHGHPQDWADNKNRVLYYHCPDNVHTRSFGRELAVPGQTVTLVKPRTLHPSVPVRLLNALRFLEISDPAWLSTILFRGRQREASVGEKLVTEGHAMGNTFTVIVSGSASVTIASQPTFEPIATLRPGEFFGLIELVDENGVHTATVTAETPIELLEIDAKLFMEYVKHHNLTETLQRIWTHRPLVESTELFRGLDLSVRNQLAKVARTSSFKAGTCLISADRPVDGLYVVLSGAVELRRDKAAVRTITSDDRDNYFGAVGAFGDNSTIDNGSIHAITDVDAIYITHEDLEHACARDMSVRYALTKAARERELYRSIKS